MTASDVDIRAAVNDDWTAIWPFFAHIIDEGRTYAYPQSLTPEAGRALWMEEPPGHTVVAKEGGAVVGSASMGPNRPGRGGHVATASFMVDPTWQGRGIGRALAGYALEWARSSGFRSMQFNAVVETNTVAVRLWHSCGFQIVGTVPEAFDHPDQGLVGLHVMYQRL